jgi:hypothetical protein
MQLHMTVDELRQRMSGAEFTKWVAFLAERNRREQAAIKRANKRNGR